MIVTSYTVCPNVGPTISIIKLEKPRQYSLLCEASFGNDLNVIPYWYIVKNGSKKLCGPPQFSIQQPHYNHSKCTWTSLLRVSQLDSEEVLFCGNGDLWANHTLSQKG